MLKRDTIFYDIVEDSDAPQKINLNLGCGDKIESDCINADKIKSNGVEIILDLEYPLPFKNNSIDNIYMDRVMAHINHPIKLRKELHRILKWGGKLYLAPCGCKCEHSRFNTDDSYTKILSTEEEVLEWISTHRGN